MAMNISDRARLYREILRVLIRRQVRDFRCGAEQWQPTLSGSLGTDSGHKLSPNRRRDARGDRNGRCSARWHGKTTLHPPRFGSPSWRVGAAVLAESGVVMGPDFAQLAASLGRNLLEGRLGILTAVFEAAPTET